MKTTEIFVEQVLIGLLVLATGYLPYCNTGKIKELFESKSIIEGAGIVAIAYLLGIVFDRFADTLLSRLDQFHRLKFALKLIENGKQYPGSDPYPEDILKIKILKAGKELNEHEHYLRIRMRLSRALAVFTPALTISGLLSLWQYTPRDNIPFFVYLTKKHWVSTSMNNIPPGYMLYFLVLGGTVLIYVLCFIIIAFVLNKLPKTYEIYGFLDFTDNEFKPREKIEKLCKVIGGEGFNLSLTSSGNTIKWLNELLMIPHFYDILKVQKPKSSFSKDKDIMDLVDKTKDYRNKCFSTLNNGEKYNIKRLNRLLLENTYPEKTPKCFSWYSSCWWDPTIIAAFILLLLGVAGSSIAVYYPSKWYLWVIIPTGAAISAISFLSWYRISETFMKFLMDCYHCDDKKERVFYDY